MPKRESASALSAAAFLCAVACSSAPDAVNPDSSAPLFSELDALRLLVDREEVFPTALQMIEEAEQEILLNMYLLGGAEAMDAQQAGIGRRVVDALAERVRDGLVVRLLSTPFDAVSDTRVAPVPDEPWFAPVYDYAVESGVPIRPPAALSGAIDHTKYLVVDGYWALFGGMNLAETVSSNRDLMVEVRGPLAVELQELFGMSWEAAADAGDGSEASLEAMSLPVGDLSASVQDALEEGWEACQSKLYLTTPDRQEIRQAILHELDALGPDDGLNVSMLLLSDAELLDGLVAAHQRQARVEVLVDPNEAYYGIDCHSAPNARGIATLHGAGVLVRHYDVQPGQELHTKAFATNSALDESRFGLGSANWTTRALTRNWETLAIFEQCPRTTAELADILSQDFAHNSRPVSAEQLAQFMDDEQLAQLSAECDDALATLSFRRGQRQ